MECSAHTYTSSQLIVTFRDTLSMYKGGGGGMRIAQYHSLCHSFDCVASQGCLGDMEHFMPIQSELRLNWNRSSPSRLSFCCGGMVQH